MPDAAATPSQVRAREVEVDSRTPMLRDSTQPSKDTPAVIRNASLALRVRLAWMR